MNSIESIRTNRIAAPMRDDLNANRMESIGPVFSRLLQWRFDFLVFAMGVNAACVVEGSRVHSRHGSAPGPEDQKHWFLHTLSSAGLGWDVIRFGLGLDGLGELWVQFRARAARPEASVFTDIELCRAGLGCHSVWAGVWMA